MAGWRSWLRNRLTSRSSRPGTARTADRSPAETSTFSDSLRWVDTSDGSWTSYEEFRERYGVEPIATTSDPLDRLGDYWDRSGKQLTLREWAHLLEDQDYRRVKVTRWGPLLVSTIWLGLNHMHWGGGKLIYETMVFDRREPDEVDMDRYGTEASALRGHQAMVDRYITPVRRRVRLGAAIGVGLAVLAFALIAASTGGVT